MNWVGHLMNQQSINGLYDSTDGFEELKVFEVKLNRGDLALRADLPKFPDHPARRWAEKANRAQVQIDFLDVTELQIQGFEAENLGVLDVKKQGGIFKFSFQAPSSNIHGTCIALRIASISAYRNESS